MTGGLYRTGGTTRRLEFLYRLPQHHIPGFPLRDLSRFLLLPQEFGKGAGLIGAKSIDRR